MTACMHANGFRDLDCEACRDAGERCPVRVCVDCGIDEANA